jgi:hypothetical protein
MDPVCGHRPAGRYRREQRRVVRMEYAGNGAIQRSAREGWLSKLFNIVSPF